MLPPFKLYRRGHLETDWISLIRANGGEDIRGAGAHALSAGGLSLRLVETRRRCPAVTAIAMRFVLPNEDSLNPRLTLIAL